MARYHSGTNTGKRVLALLLFLVAAIIAFAVSSYYEAKSYQEPRGDVSESTAGVITIDGTRYREKVGMTTFLLIGYDRTDSGELKGFRDGGQSDFLMLVAIDGQSKEVHRLLLDRNTMTPVGVLGVLGAQVGTRTMQICLSHAFGNTREACNEHTLEAVSNLLEGLDIKLYLAMNMSGIATFNDAIGGVTVTIDKSFTDIDKNDSTLVPGTTVHLMGEHAYNYVHARMNVGEGTNQERMMRHNAYLDGAVSQLQARLNESNSFINTLLDVMGDVLQTNMSRGRIVNEVNRAMKYNLLPIEYLPGKTVIGYNDYEQFYPEENAVLDWLLSVYYTRIS